MPQRLPLLQLVMPLTRHIDICVKLGNVDAVLVPGHLLLQHVDAPVVLHRQGGAWLLQRQGNDGGPCAGAGAVALVTAHCAYQDRMILQAMLFMCFFWNSCLVFTMLPRAQQSEPVLPAQLAAAQAGSRAHRV